MTVVPGRLGLAFGARFVPMAAALVASTSLGVGRSPQAARSGVSAAVTIKTCRIGVIPPGKVRRTLIPTDASAYHVFPLAGDGANVITRSAGPLHGDIGFRRYIRPPCIPP